MLFCLSVFLINTLTKCILKSGNVQTSNRIIVCKGIFLYFINMLLFSDVVTKTYDTRFLNTGEDYTKIILEKEIRKFVHFYTLG